MGHAYEIVLADVMARYHRLAGRDVLFVTGSDDHGQVFFFRRGLLGVVC